jgi:succinylglutamate desuccinylase
MIPNSVLVFGGTHGNEWTGVYAIRKFADALRRDVPGLSVEFILANPEAFALNRRFKDEDLNRAFQFLNEARPGSFEHRRARELRDRIQAAPCFVIDLHTTTSRMGNTVIITREHPLNLRIAAELVARLPDTRAILSPDPHRKYLVSQSDTGLMIEVGPVANGVLDATALAGTRAVLAKTLRALATPSNLTKTTLEIYEEIEDVYYPQDEAGELLAYIHEGFQGSDFDPVNGEYAPFRAFDGKEIKRLTSETRYPIFINEAAYYPTKLAYTLCRKKVLSI